MLPCNAGPQPFPNPHKPFSYLQHRARADYFGKATPRIRMKNRQPAVYLLASARNGTLYVGVTSDLPQRIFQHKENLVAGFARRHHVHQLVWFELHETMESAIHREKCIKEWRRAWKVRLIEFANPGWRDLSSTLD